MIDTSMVPEPAHRCARPPLHHEWADGERTSLRLTHAIGTRFHCEVCGLVWVAVMLPPEVGPRVYMAERAVWRRETWRERRRRRRAARKADHGR